jgi:Ni/Co efflux regulator RcnB
MTYSHTPQPPLAQPATGSSGRDVLSDQAAWLERRQPAYLVAALGRPGSAEWRELALEIERFRRGSGITSRACALGGLPGDPEGAGERSRLARRISRYQGVNELGFEDLCVFTAPAERVRDQAALSLLEDRRWLGALSATEIQTIIRMPTLVLRRHVSYAVGLLRDRPADRAARLPGVEAEIRAVRANQGPHQAAVREASARLRSLRDRSPSGEQVGTVAVRLEATMAVHKAALERLELVRRGLEHEQTQARQAARDRSHWDDRHRLPLAVGLHSAYELAQRDLEAVIALEGDPPAYLQRELGDVPNSTAGRMAWRDGARLIERYRAEYHIDYPTAALGPPPSDQAAAHARQQTAEEVAALKVEIHAAPTVGDLPGDSIELDLGPAGP